MDIIKFGYFYLLVNVLLFHVESYDDISMNEETYKNIKLNINYTLQLNRSVPGVPGQDYPIYSEVPNTSFTCNDKQEGYYSDIETKCQAFRVCANTAKSSQGFAFLCPNGTLFSQNHLVCDWYNNVNCNASIFYYENNLNVGTELDIINTIQHMIEYPIKMLIEGSIDDYTKSAKMENIKNHKNDTDIKNNRTNSLTNGLGLFTPEINGEYGVENSSISTILNIAKSDVYLASHINNLAEIDVANMDGDNRKEHSFRYLSHEFSIPKESKIAEQFIITEESDEVSLSSTSNNGGSRTQFDQEISNAGTITIIPKHNNSFSAGSNENQFNNPPTSDFEYSNSTGKSESLQTYSSNLLISGVIQSSIEHNPYDNNATTKSKQFKNFYTRNFQERLKITSKNASVATLKPQAYIKETTTNRIIHPTTKIPYIIKTSVYKGHNSVKIEKESRKNYITRNNKLKIENHNAIDQKSIPTWESVRKNLMRYQVPIIDMVQKPKKVLNIKNSSDILKKSAIQNTVSNTEIGLNTIHFNSSEVGKNDPSRTFQSNNLKEKNDSQENALNIKEFLNRKFGAGKSNVISQQTHKNFENSQKNISSYGQFNEENAFVRPIGILENSNNLKFSYYNQLPLANVSPKTSTHQNYENVVDSSANQQFQFPFMPRFIYKDNSHSSQYSINL